MNSRKLILAVSLLLLALAINAASGYVIHTYYPDRPAVPDLLFSLTPYVGWTQYLTDLANAASVILLALYVFRGRTNLIPWIIAVFATMEILRGFITPLTPLGDVLGNEAYYGLTHIRQYGCFPSGHFATAILCYYFIDRLGAPRLKRLAAFCIAIEGASLVLSRGHYSIDLVGGFLLAYFAYHSLEKYRGWLTS